MPPLNRLKNPIYPFLALLFVLLAAFVCVMFSQNAEKLVGGFLGLREKNEILKFLGFGMGGVLLVIQAGISYRRARAMEDAANAQAGATAEQAKANENAEKGLRQERLKNAIEHLGNKSDSVRLGGAYELFHLAQDTPELRQSVLDVLCAHIRQTTGESEYIKKYKSKPSEEIQSLLTLLFVQEHEIFKNLHINLRGSWLKRAELENARLEGANLIGTWLQGAFLTEVKLQNADLSAALLQGAHLTDAQLQEARLIGAQLQGAQLDGAQLQMANLSKARLQGAYLVEAQLPGARLYSAMLQRASLGEAQLQGAYLTRTQLQGVIDCEDPPVGFVESMRNGIGRESDFSDWIFSGGLEPEDIDSLLEGLSDEKAQELRKKLQPHIGQPKSNKLPENSGAITGFYTKEEAEEWIAEYEKFVGTTTGMGDS